MANTYKTVGGKGGTAFSTVYTCPQGKTAFVTLARTTNVTAAVATATIAFFDSSTATSFAIVNNLPVPVGGSVRIFEDRLVLEAGDYIQFKSGTANSLDFVMSVMEV